MSILLIIIGFILLILGIIGCIAPVLPGPPLNFLAMLAIQFARHGEAFTTHELIIWGTITVIITVLDYFIPVVGAKKYGASKVAVWTSIIGLFVGLIFFPPLGMFVGAFLGAVAGEFLVGKKKTDALKAGWGVFVGTMVGIGFKLAASIGMSFYFIKALI